MQRLAVVEADEQVLADRFDARDGGARQIDTAESRVPGHASNASFTDEPLADLVGQSPDRVALRHVRNRTQPAECLGPTWVPGTTPRRRWAFRFLRRR